MNIEQINEIEHKIIQHRRFIHKNPELGFNEIETNKYISNCLNKLKIEHEIVCETGIVAIIGDKEKYKDNCVAFRCEMDALPVLEDTDLPYSSINQGVMHACGHDMHIAMLLGAAEIFQKKVENLKGCIKLIFQPSEEILPGGAKHMIKQNCLKNPTPKMIFAQHINPELEVGAFEASLNFALASTCEIKITINGKSTHGSTPHLGNDPILVASNIINFSNSFLIRNNNPLEPAILSICAINGGTVNNAFPTQVKMLGTLRTLNEENRDRILDLWEKKVKLLCTVYDTSCCIDIVKGYPPVINNEKAFNIVKDSVIRLYGENRFKMCPPKMWTEDFSYYAKEIPACFYFLGVKSDDQNNYSLHSNKLNPDENAMKYGVALILEIAKNFM